LLESIGCEALELPAQAEYVIYNLPKQGPPAD